MQRSIAVKEINEMTNLIKKTRDAINAYLGRQHSVIIEGQIPPVIYPNDASGRLTKLQELIGYAPYVTEHCPCLLAFTMGQFSDIDKNKQLWKERLGWITLQLMALLEPIPDFPPIPEPLRKLIDTSADNLSLAFLIVSELIRKEAILQSPLADLLTLIEVNSSNEMSADNIVQATQQYESQLTRSPSTLFFTPDDTAEQAAPAPDLDPEP